VGPTLSGKKELECVSKVARQSLVKLTGVPVSAVSKRGMDDENVPNGPGQSHKTKNEVIEEGLRGADGVTSRGRGGMTVLKFAETQERVTQHGWRGLKSSFQNGGNKREGVI